MVADAFGHGELPGPGPNDTAPALSLRHIIIERGEGNIAATMGRAWVAFQELFAMAEDNRRQTTPDDG
jgi:hypothetical protein